MQAARQSGDLHEKSKVGYSLKIFQFTVAMTQGRPAAI
jgi:hypothetical protein